MNRFHEVVASHLIENPHHFYSSNKETRFSVGPREERKERIVELIRHGKLPHRTQPVVLSYAYINLTPEH